MATIRTSGASALVDTLGVISTAASTLNHTIGSAGRMASALHTKADAYATSIENKAKLDKLDAGEIAIQNWAIQSQERLLELKSRIKDQALYDQLVEQARKALA